MPELEFGVLEAEVIPFAASPTMMFKVRIVNATEGEKIQSIMLRAQIRMEVTRRQYDDETEARLLDVFGRPSQWGDTLRSLLWTHTMTIVPSFEGSAVFEMPVTCTYDFEVVSSKYFHALRDGDVPLIFLFSGTVFYTGDDDRLQIAPVPWEAEATFRLPVRYWHEMMDRYFPNAAWLRVQRDVFDRLHDYLARRALPSWDAALEELLQAREAEMERS